MCRARRLRHQTSAPVTASAPAAGERADVQIIAAANIDAIARLLREGRAPHLDQLMQLLDMIKRHAGADPPRNAEAREGWTAFSDYALRYLSGIEGLKREVERVGGGLKT